MPAGANTGSIQWMGKHFGTTKSAKLCSSLPAKSAATQLEN